MARRVSARYSTGVTPDRLQVATSEASMARVPAKRAFFRVGAMGGPAPPWPRASETTARKQPLFVAFRPGSGTGAARPVAERAAVEVEPLPLEDPGLAVEWQVVAEPGDDDPCDQPFGRQPARHDMLGRMGLHHGLRAAATGVSRAARHQNPELRRDHVEPPGDILPDPGHLATAAGAKGAGRRDHALDPGQMPTVARGQVLPRPSPVRPPARPGPVRHLRAAD